MRNFPCLHQQAQYFNTITSTYSFSSTYAIQGHREVEPIPVGIVRKALHNLDGSLVHCSASAERQTTIHTYGQFKIKINISLSEAGSQSTWREPMETNSTQKGVDSNPEPSCCEKTVCCPQHNYKFQVPLLSKYASFEDLHLRVAGPWGLI